MAAGPRDKAMAERETLSSNTGELYLVPLGEIRRIKENISDPFLLSEILADIFRINTLYMVERAGSGHLGTSFSAMDIVTLLWTKVMKSPNEPGSKNGDTYFSSKGHDAPGLYSLLIGLEKLPFDLVHKLRRLDGLPGHPDIVTPHIAANTGSLGMGISKARGMALARRLNKTQGRFYVLTGDGELQEGQIWESLQPTVNGKFSEITVIVDHNKFQSDKKVEEVSHLGEIENKFRSFGWEVARTDGHDVRKVHEILERFEKIKDRPQILIADTSKGRGVSFMEKVAPDGLYKFHSGAPRYDDYRAALEEISGRLNEKFSKLGLGPLKLESFPAPERVLPKKPENLVEAYGEELVKIGHENKEIVVLDADLMPDCGITNFSRKFPERFFECGIAEQDMVSLAGGLALFGKIPVVHSFACFLSTRPNEQIYNNATEKKKIIYVGTLAGLLPGGPGHSHQSVRDISALGGVPGLVMIEPANENEAKLAIRWAVDENPGQTYLRFSNVPLDLPYSLSPDYKLEKGRGVFLANGKEAALVSYGPVMLREAFLASGLLKEKKFGLAVMNFPWLNAVDSEWAQKELGKFKTIFVMDDHYSNSGLGGHMARALAKKGGDLPRVVFLGLEEIPACGWDDEGLKYHGLDAESLVR